LLQTLTLYILNFYNMTESQVKDLNQQLPPAERDWTYSSTIVFSVAFSLPVWRVTK
jgi:hypothetical protein